MSDQEPNHDTEEQRGGLLGHGDCWAAEHVWHPRAGPWFAYMVLLALTVAARDHLPESYGLLKVVQLALICGLIWRWRKLVPELTWRFHWLAVPVAIFLAMAWIWLNEQMIEVMKPDLPKSMFEKLHEDKVFYFWLAAIGHLLAMAIAVPMIEETFNRSLMLRSLHRPRQTATGLIQFLCDVPVLGDWLIHTRIGTRAAQADPMFAKQFEQIPLGQLSFFGVIASSIVFMLVHQRHDWPGAFLCGVVWCLMLRFTREKGLGPVIWSHALTNVLLWGYVIKSEIWHLM